MRSILRDPCFWAFFALPMSIAAAFLIQSGFPDAVHYYLAGNWR